MTTDTKQIPANRTRTMRLKPLFSVLAFLLVAHAKEEGTPILKHVSHMTEQELNQAREEGPADASHGHVDIPPVPPRGWRESGGDQVEDSRKRHVHRPRRDQ